MASRTPLAVAVLLLANAALIVRAQEDGAAAPEAAAPTPPLADPNMVSATAKLLLNLQPGQPWTWPRYERGAGAYEFVMSKQGLARGLTHLGTANRLRRAMSKVAAGQNITIATIGGSITAGQGAVDGHNWVQYLENYVTDHFNGLITVANGAVPGTLSSYMSVCLNIHVPKTADIVFVEYNQNDPQRSDPLFGSSQRKHFERLLRKLLLLPNRPAVVLVHSYAWTLPSHAFYGMYWGTAEREFQEFATFYDLPTLSVKGCCHQLMAEGVPGFRVDKTRQEDREGLARQAFNWDVIHPDGLTGTRVMAELAIHAIQSALKSVTDEPLTRQEADAAEGPLPAPLIPHNYQSLTDTCFIGSHFTSIVTYQDRFDWVNEAKNGSIRPKWGFVANETGAAMRITVSTVASSSGAGPHKAPLKKHQTKKMKHQQQQLESDPASNLVMVELAYLQSYVQMGRANVSCVSGCECTTSKLEGHTTHKNSQLHLHTFHVTQSPECVIEIKVRGDSAVRGNRKVKVAGLIISEEAGSHTGGVRNSAAVEYVHDISSIAKDAIYDIKNHARK